jgi:hypothetical protein
MFAVRHADIETFARELEARGRTRATVTRRLCTIAGLYKYAVEEKLLDHSPTAHVRRPRLDYESHATALDRNELGGILVAAGLGSPAEHALISLLAGGQDGNAVKTRLVRVVNGAGSRGPSQTTCSPNQPMRSSVNSNAVIPVNSLSSDARSRSLIAAGGRNGYSTVTCAGTPSLAASSSRARCRLTAGSAAGTGTRSAVSPPGPVLGIKPGMPARLRFPPGRRTWNFPHRTPGTPPWAPRRRTTV